MIPAHPLAELFPMLADADAAALAADIGANGLRDRIVILNGQILDGRNRHRAAVAAGVLAEGLPADDSDLWMSHFRRFVPVQDGDPLAWVLSKNLHRRHLNDGQRSMIAERLATMTVGRPAKAENSANLRNMSVDAAAEQLHVSPRSVTAARAVRQHGAPELVASVERGEVAVSTAAEVAKLPVREQLRLLREQHPREFGRVVREQRAEKQTEKRERREAREVQLGQRLHALPDRRYGVIIADPEWEFKSWGENGMDRAPDNHYPTSPTDVIASRPVGSIAADSSVLLLWATAPRLPDALIVMQAWGFAYVTHMVWAKDRVGAARGPGYWFTGEHELVLLGKRGDIPAPAQGKQFRSLFHAPVGQHSEKPPTIHEMAEAYFPNLPKIELNARARRAGWDAWGFEAPEQVSAKSAAIATDKATALPIIEARYTGDNAQQLADELGRPINTIRKWAFELGKTSQARNVARLQDINRERAQ